VGNHDLTVYLVGALSGVLAVMAIVEVVQLVRVRRWKRAGSPCPCLVCAVLRQEAAAEGTASQ